MMELVNPFRSAVTGGGRTTCSDCGHGWHTGPCESWSAAYTYTDSPEYSPCECGHVVEILPIPADWDPDALPF